jgi:hyperosmotically inducible protein
MGSMNDSVISKGPFTALLVLAALGAIVGCDKRDGNDATDRREAAAEKREEVSEKREEQNEVIAADADDTKKNVRDRDPDSVTPFDQKNNESDLEITQKIRQGVVGADGFSMDARNVKIVTANGVVTLRGPVESDRERTRIVEMAQKTPGVTRVDDQLEVARQ